MKVIQRNYVLDLFKLIAAICIVGIHCKFLFNLNPFAFQVITNGFFMVAVPLFICINGFYINKYFKQNLFKVWLKRLVILYVVWSFFYCYFWVVPFNFLKAIKTLLFGFNHLWYLIALLFAGLLLFLLKEIKPKLLLFLALCCFVIGLSIQYLGLFNVFESNSLAFKIVNYPPIYRNFIFYAFPFLTFGYLIKKTNLHQNISKYKCILLMLIGSVLVLLEALVHKQLFSHYVVVNMHLSYLIMVPSVLIFALKSNIRLGTNSKFLANISVGIYLVHPWVIFFLLSFYSFKGTELTILTLVMSVFLSLILIKLNNILKFLL